MINEMSIGECESGSFMLEDAKLILLSGDI